MERMYGRSGKYTADEWQGVIAEQRHKAQVSKRFEPRKNAILRQVEQKLLDVGVPAEKVSSVAALIQKNRLAKVQWSTPAIKKSVLAIHAWYGEQMGNIAIDQIDADNEIHVWGK